MFEILLQDNSDQPIYLTLYKHIRNIIRNGDIADGMRLPSVRALQIQLNISKTPIETAYQMLISEGFVVSKPRSGLYVVNPNKTPLAKLKGNELDGPIIQTNSQKSQQISTGNKRIIDFDPTAVNTEKFPIRIWNKMVKEAIESNEVLLGKYGDPQGEEKLRNLLAEYLFNSRGVHCTPEQIFIGNGMVNSIKIISILLKDIHNFAIEEPGYDLARNQLMLNGFELTPIHVEASGLSIKELETCSAKAVYVTPSHQFPTGCIMSYTKREHLLKWAFSNEAFIIEDDYDGEFRYIGKPIPSLQGLDDYGRVIYIGTFSKVFTPALRMNYMVLPKMLMDRLKDIPHEISSTPSRIDQWAMSSFIEQGHWYRHIRRVRNLYRQRHQLLIKLIQEKLGHYVEITGQNAGLHIQLTVKTHQSVEILIETAATEGVKVYDFKNMWMSKKTGDFPRLFLGFGGVSEKDMEIGISLLKKAWSPFFLS